MKNAKNTNFRCHQGIYAAQEKGGMRTKAEELFLGPRANLVQICMQPSHGSFNLA
jgi:hypothetical protein